MKQFAEYYNLYLPYYVMIVSSVAFVITAIDKILSKTKVRRVPEKRFVLLGAIGGGLGVLSAFYLIRHKTKHDGLLFAVWASTILSYCVLCGVSIFFQINF